MKSLSLLSIALLLSFSSIGQDKPQPSPSSKLIQTVGLTQVTVEYSRPGVKDRTIFGNLLKYGEVWRTGANAATKFTFDKPVTIGGKSLEAGSYTILSVPGEKEWKVSFYKYDKPGWNTYTELQPVVSTNITPTKLSEPVETFIIDINNLRDTSATIDLVWQKTKVSIPITVGK